MVDNQAWSTPAIETFDSYHRKFRVCQKKFFKVKKSIQHILVLFVPNDSFPWKAHSFLFDFNVYLKIKDFCIH